MTRIVTPAGLAAWHIVPWYSRLFTFGWIAGQSTTVDKSLLPFPGLIGRQNFALTRWDIRSIARSI